MTDTKHEYDECDEIEFSKDDPLNFGIGDIVKQIRDVTGDDDEYCEEDDTMYYEVEYNYEECEYRTGKIIDVKKGKMNPYLVLFKKEGKEQLNDHELLSAMITIDDDGNLY